MRLHRCTHAHLNAPLRSHARARRRAPHRGARAARTHAAVAAASTQNHHPLTRNLSSEKKLNRLQHDAKRKIVLVMEGARGKGAAVSSAARRRMVAVRPTAWRRLQMEAHTHALTRNTFCFWKKQREKKAGTFIRFAGRGRELLMMIGCGQDTETKKKKRSRRLWTYARGRLTLFAAPLSVYLSLSTAPL